MGYEYLKVLKDTDKSKVYLVYDAEHHKTLVEKHLNGELPVYRQLQKLNHPYLPELYDVQIANGKTVIIEEYINGNSLAQIQVTEKQLSRWLLELCDVLYYLHQRQIIHRDIKPSNLLIGKDGHIRLIDFDAARESKENAESDTRLLGTKGFAPPEQYGFAQTDQRTDIYAIGVTWKALLGDRAKKPPYSSILDKCTELNPDMRFYSVKALAAAWKNRHIRRLSPWIGICAVFAIALFLGYSYQKNLPEITSSRYPDEDILFYSVWGEYIIAKADNLRHNGEIQTMKVDLNGDQDKESLELKADKDGNIQVILRAQNEKDLLSDINKDVPIVHYLNHTNAWVEFQNQLDSEYIQVTCLDLDDNGNAEILISIGDRIKHLVTVVYQLQDGAFYSAGFLWGSTTLKQLHDGSLEAGLLTNPYQDSNRYQYTDGVKEISCLDYAEYWDMLENGMSYEDLLELLDQIQEGE